MARLYAAEAGAVTSSDLYSVDPATGAMTSVGPIGYAVTGLAVDPLTGILYGSTSGNSAVSPNSIITIDKTTGAGTLVGDLGLGAGHNAADICFNAAGQLFGWDSHGNTDPTNGLITINKATGAAAHVGSPGLITSGDALDFDAGGILWLFPLHAFTAAFTSYYIVNPATGAVTDQFPPNNLGFAPIHGDVVAGSFDGSDVFYAVIKGGAGARLVTIDTSTGTITNVGTMLAETGALGWDNAAGGGVTADFVATPLAGHPPLAVQFTDLSAGSPTTWLWTFGDGDSSADQNPLHTYELAGVYDVTLTAT